MHSESLLETFCLIDITCFYAVARILKKCVRKWSSIWFYQNICICAILMGERSWKFAKWNLCLLARNIPDIIQVEYIHHYSQGAHCLESKRVKGPTIGFGFGLGNLGRVYKKHRFSLDLMFLESGGCSLIVFSINLPCGEDRLESDEICDG